MPNQQLIWTSKTFWSAIIGAVGAIIGIFKPNLLGSDQADQLAGAIAVLASFIGVLWGRQTADGSNGFKLLPCLLAGLLLLGVGSMGGCAGSVSPIWAAENSQYEHTVVEGTLLPHYMNDPAIPAAAKDNVQKAVNEHKDRLADWESSPSAPPH